MIIRSHISGSSWPSIPSPADAALLVLQFQLEQSQWWAPEQILLALNCTGQTLDSK